jgi:hypothetical protein
MSRIESQIGKNICYGANEATLGSSKYTFVLKNQPSPTYPLGADGTRERHQVNIYAAANPDGRPVATVYFNVKHHAPTAEDGLAVIDVRANISGISHKSTFTLLPGQTARLREQGKNPLQLGLGVHHLLPSTS